MLAGGALVWSNNGGTAYETTVYSGGHVYGFKYVGAGSTTITQLGGRTVQGTFSSAVVESGYVGSVGSGGNVIDTTVDFGGRLEVYVRARGTVDGTAVQSSGTLLVSSNGTALNTTVSRGGRVSLEYGAVASNTTVLAGGTLVWSNNGGTAYETTVYNGGYVYDFKYVGAGSTTISQLGGRTVQGTFSSAVVESGYAGRVGSGGNVIDTTVDFGGRLEVPAVRWMVPRFSPVVLCW